MGKAKELETGIEGLSISLGKDGIWLNTSSKSGRHSCINLVSIARKHFEHPSNQALLDWCEEIARRGK